MTIVVLSSRAEIVEEMERPDSSQDRLYRTLAPFQLVNLFHPVLAEIWTYPAEALAERIPPPR